MTDLEFIKKCTSGDKQSWDEFLEKYSRLIYNYIYSVLRIKNVDHFTTDNINDLFQEIFLLLVKDNFKKLKSFKGSNGCSFASWLRQVVINATIDNIRKERPVVSIEEENDLGLSVKDMLVDGKDTAKDIAQQKEKFNSLKDCIEKLVLDDKYLLELHMSQGLSLEELKDHLKLSRGAVDMRKSRILDKLKDCFKKKGFDV